MAEEATPQQKAQLETYRSFLATVDEYHQRAFDSIDRWLMAVGGVGLGVAVTSVASSNNINEWLRVPFTISVILLLCGFLSGMLAKAEAYTTSMQLAARARREREHGIDNLYHRVNIQHQRLLWRERVRLYLSFACFVLTLTGFVVLVVVGLLAMHAKETSSESRDAITAAPSSATAAPSSATTAPSSATTTGADAIQKVPDPATRSALSERQVEHGGFENLTSRSAARPRGATS